MICNGGEKKTSKSFVTGYWYNFLAKNLSKCKKLFNIKQNIKKNGPQKSINMSFLTWKSGNGGEISIKVQNSNGGEWSGNLFGIPW